MNGKVLTCWDIDTLTLVDFYDKARDIIWMRNGEYQGGTGYAADGAPIRWGDLIEATAYNVLAWAQDFAGVVGLLSGNRIEQVGGGVSILGGAATRVTQVGPPLARFERSWSAALRVDNAEAVFSAQHHDISFWDD